ncbi:methyltransferase domain protein [Medicago truncatula]|uniref:Methyltransferase domain protein n=1 Tax=Medicago truncatula TaxID=3880 RepID=G7L367_MEDTR|nr:methyltransferase domain protein [Medicago truncatula]
MYNHLEKREKSQEKEEELEGLRFHLISVTEPTSMRTVGINHFLVSSRYSWTSREIEDAENASSCILQADFMKMPFEDNSFDAVYAIEATCHAPDAVSIYTCTHVLSIILDQDCDSWWSRFLMSLHMDATKRFIVLKPGQCFAAYEWCMTDSYEWCM